MDIDSFILLAADKDGYLYQVDVPSNKLDGMAKVLAAQRPDGKLPVCGTPIEGLEAKPNTKQNTKSNSGNSQNK